MIAKILTPEGAKENALKTTCNSHLSQNQPILAYEDRKPGERTLILPLTD